MLANLFLMLRKGKAKNINDMGSKTILSVPNIKKGTKNHPTEKPIELLEILIENSSNKKRYNLRSVCWDK